MVVFLSDSQLAELERNPQYNRFEGKCPTCQGTGEFRYEGVVNDCPRDNWGRHLQHELFKKYCLANIPLEFQQLDWQDYPDAKIKEEIDQYIDNFEKIRVLGMGWEIYGKKRGVGKTWAGTAILKELILKGYEGWFVQFPDLRNYHEMADKVQRDWLISKVRNTEVLVIDEVLKPYASTKQATFYEDVLESIIRFRTTNNFPTILTTNMVETDIHDLFPRVYSLLSAKQWRIELGGEDFRVTTLFDTNAELAKKGEVRPIV